MVNGKAASKDDSMAPHTQQYREMTVVSGPATGDGFSREGFDVDDVRDNGYEVRPSSIASQNSTQMTSGTTFFNFGVLNSVCRLWGIVLEVCGSAYVKSYRALRVESPILAVVDRRYGCIRHQPMNETHSGRLQRTVIY